MRRTALGALCSVGLAGTLFLAACGASGAATSGGTSGAKAAAAAGGGANCKPGTAAATKAPWVMLCLAYNEQVFGVANTTNPAPSFDQSGNCLDPTDPAWPKPDSVATASGVDFWFPATGGGKTAVKSAINLGPEDGGAATVNVPAGRYKELAILGSVGNGPGTVDIQFNYSDGTKDTTTQQMDDWCSTSPTGQPGFMPADRWSNAGATETPACGVFVYTVPIPGSSKTLKSIGLTSDSSNGSQVEIEILSLSLEQA
jgi:hypothetical protein